MKFYFGKRKRADIRCDNEGGRMYCNVDQVL